MNTLTTGRGLPAFGPAMIGNAVGKLPTSLALTGFGRSKFYQLIAEGLLPPPVKIGPKMAVWPISELNAVMGAHIAGKSPEAIKALVAELVAARSARA